MKLVRVGVLVGLAVAQTLVFVSPAAAASATTVTVSRGQLVVQAGTDVANKIRVTESDGMLYVSDVVSVSPGEDCKRVKPGEVACPMTGIGSVFIGLGDGDDLAEMKIPLVAAIVAGPGNDQISGGPANDTLSGGPGDDQLSGGSGTDSLYGGTGKDVLHGGFGNDYLQGGDSADAVFGDEGNDTLEELPAAGPQANKLDGGFGDDKIIGSGDGMRDMAIYSWRSHDVGGNLSAFDYQGSVFLPAGSGGELGSTGQLVEHDMLVKVDGLLMGSGNDTLIGHGISPIFSPGLGNNQCDFNGNDGFQLTSC